MVLCREPPAARGSPECIGRALACGCLRAAWTANTPGWIDCTEVAGRRQPVASSGTSQPCLTRPELHQGTAARSKQKTPTRALRAEFVRSFVRIGIPPRGHANPTTASVAPALLPPIRTRPLMETVLLLGVMQGVITGVGLLIHAGRRNGTHWLAFGVLALSLTLLRLWTHAAGLESQPWLRRLPLSFDLAIFPLFHLYALSLSAAPAATIRRAFAWLLPWAVFMGYSVLVYLAGSGESNVQQMDAVAERWHYARLKRIEDYLTIGINTVLAVLVWSRISGHHRRIAHWVPERFANLLQLLKVVMALALATAIVNLVAFASQHLFQLGDRSVISHAAGAFHVALIYIAGIVGFRLMDLPRFPDAEAEPATRRPDPRIEASYQALQTLMETDHLYAEPDLDLGDVAQRLGLTATEASRVIKEGAGKHFRAYVNDFRIQAVKQKLRDVDYRGVSILAISLESGFNSESSFYRVFKASTGMSPTEFRQRS